MFNDQNAIKLWKDCAKKLDEMECRTVTLKGVKNLSRSDLETLQMYAKLAIREGLHGYGLAPLRGNLLEVWNKYNVGDMEQCKNTTN